MPDLFSRKIVLAVFLFLALHLAACASREEAVVITPLPETTAASVTAIPPTATVPTAAPTNTAEATATDFPTATPRPTPTLIPPGTMLEINKLEDFTLLFDQDQSSRRLVLFLSTSCSSCLAGARWLEESILATHPELDVQVYAVWLAIVPGELLPTELRGQRDENLLNDPRVIHFWDRIRLVDQWFAANLELEGPERTSLRQTYGNLDWGTYIWDAYFLFAPDARWETAPEFLVSSGYPIIQNREQIRTALSVEPAAVATTADEDTVVYRIVPAESFVYYRVAETFSGRRFNVAIGVTSSISGQVTIDLAQPAASQVDPIAITIRDFQSDNFLRDERIQEEFLESNLYPVATFTPREIRGLPETYTPGETVTFEMLGDLEVRETAVPTTFTVMARLENGRLTGTAMTQVLMTDFGFDPPNLADLIAAENEVDIILEFVAEPVQP